MLSGNIPQIRISLSSGEALDPGLKKEISQQVREFRAQKLSQRGRSPGQVQNQSQSAGQGHGAARSQTEAVSQAAVAAGAGPRDKPRDRPLSAPSQAAQLKAVQPRPQSPRQGPSPRPGPEPAFTPVSTRPRCRSHSPRFRIDVEVEWRPPARQGGLSSAASHQNLATGAAAALSPVDPLSLSFPDEALQSALSRRGPPALFLQVPDDRGAGRSNSVCDLSASATADVLRWSLAEAAPPRSLSSHQLAEACWGRPPSPGPQSPLRSSASFGCLADTPPRQLDRPPTHNFLSPEHAACRLHVSPVARLSPNHSPFGSQNLIYAGGDF